MKIFQSIKIAFALLLLLGAQMSLFAQNNVVDEVIWVVGDEAILRSDVEAARLTGGPVKGDPYCVIPEQLAIQKLFLHQAAIDSIEAGPAEINRAVEYIEELRKKYTVEIFEEVLKTVNKH